MSLATMIASADRLSKNVERKMSKPIIKKESKVNVNDKQIKKVSKTMCTATVRARMFLKISICFSSTYSLFLIPIMSLIR